MNDQHLVQDKIRSLFVLVAFLASFVGNFVLGEDGFPEVRYSKLNLGKGESKESHAMFYLQLGPFENASKPSRYLFEIGDDNAIHIVAFKQRRLPSEDPIHFVLVRGKAYFFIGDDPRILKAIEVSADGGVIDFQKHKIDFDGAVTAQEAEIAKLHSFTLGRLDVLMREDLQDYMRRE